jgi:hypothetical protein
MSKACTFLAFADPTVGLMLGSATEAGQGISVLVITDSPDPRTTIYDTWRDGKRVI